VDYLRTVGRDMVRLVDPDFPLNPNPAVGNAGTGISITPDEYLDRLPAMTARGAITESATIRLVGRLYDTGGMLRGDIGGLRTYERLTRLAGPPMLVLLVLAIGSPVLTTGRERRVAVLLTASAFLLTIGPVLIALYNWRYQVAALGPLALAAAFGAQGLIDRLSARRRRRAEVPG
jgi:hypothetical protein